MATNTIITDISKIDKRFESLNSKLEALVSLQQKFRNDPFSGPSNLPEISTIQHDIELLLHRQLPKDIEAMKYKYGLNHKCLRHKRNQALLKYMRISKDIGSEIWDSQAGAMPQRDDTSRHEYNQFKAGVHSTRVDLVYGRHGEIKKIERSFVELCQINHDLHEIAGAQDDVMRPIKQRGEGVFVDMTENSNAELEMSTEKCMSKSKHQKWRWFIIVLAMLIAVIIAIVIYSQLRK